MFIPKCPFTCQTAVKICYFWFLLVTASQRVPRGPAGRRLRVASMATQSWWRLHGTRPRARRAASSPQLAVGAATVWPTPSSPFWNKQTNKQTCTLKSITLNWKKMKFIARRQWRERLLLKRKGFRTCHGRCSKGPWWPHHSDSSLFDWCCFYYFLRNSLVALLEALFAHMIWLKNLSQFWWYLQTCRQHIRQHVPPTKSPLMTTRIWQITTNLPLQIAFWRHLVEFVLPPYYRSDMVGQMRVIASKQKSRHRLKRFELSNSWHHNLSRISPCKCIAPVSSPSAFSAKVLMTLEFASCLLPTSQERCWLTSTA